MITRGLKLSPRILSTLNLPQIIDITDQLPKHPTKVWPRRSLESIRLAVQHHMASEAPLVNQCMYHINAHDWAGLAYTFVVSGQSIYQTNDLLSLTSHAKGANGIGVGLCVHGDLSKRPMSDFERRATMGIHLMLRELLPDVQVMGHNEASLKYANHRTSCPVISMPKLREDIEAAEEDLDYRESTPYLNAEVFAFFERFSALETRMTKFPAESRRKIMRMAPVMAELGHKGDMTPESILKRIKEVRASAIINGRWSDEGRRKAAIGAKYAREVGLLG